MSDKRIGEPNIMFNNSIFTGGTYTMQTTLIQSAHGNALKLLREASSPSAFHNSGERNDPPKCHENTRVAVLKKVMDWIIGCDPQTRDKWIMWLSGGAGAGKSAIAQTMAERCDAEGRLLASFFFGRSDGTRNHARFLIPTIACQIYANIPGVRDDIASVINNDPLIFNKSLLIQLMTLVVEPLRRHGDTASQHLIIIDGLDECIDRASQVAILHTLLDAVQKRSCRLHFLVVSRPEHDIVNALSSQNVELILARLALDNKYQSYKDIELFLTEKFEKIAKTHPFRKHIPTAWPGTDVVQEIARKSSGQFIFASIVAKYVESIRHRPDQRLKIVRNLCPCQDSDLPFAELDALYTHIFSSIENVSLVVEILSFIVHQTHTKGFSYSEELDLLATILTVDKIEEIHALKPGSLQILFCDLSALISVDDFLGLEIINVLHASIMDFLIDPSRSKDLHVPTSVLITKHVTRCLRVLSRNDDKEITQHAIEFLIIFCEHVTFTADMASALEKFSLLKLFQHDTSWMSVNLTFLLRLNPILLNLIRQSDQYQFWARYTAMMDETYIALLDAYPPEYLALRLLSTIIHSNIFPSKASHKSFQLQQSFPGRDYLWILQEPDYNNTLFYGPTDSIQAHFDEYKVSLRQFLLDPVRSRHHNFQKSAGKMYVTSLLACFSYLDAQLFHDNDLQKEHPNSILHSPPAWYAPNNTKWKEHPTINEDWGQYIPCSQQNVDIVDTDKDIQAWSANWEQLFPKQDIDWEYLLSFQLPLTDRDLLIDPDPDYLPKHWLGRYGLMLGYMIYFFPRAGKSQKLIELSKTTILPRDATLFPEDTVRAQRAMAAYVKRIESLDDDE